MDGVGHNLLDLLRETLLQRLRDDGAAGGVGDLAGLLVGAGVVKSVWDLVLDGAGDLSMILVRCCEGVQCGEDIQPPEPSGAIGSQWRGTRPGRARLLQTFW